MSGSDRGIILAVLIGLTLVVLGTGVYIGALAGSDGSPQPAVRGQHSPSQHGQEPQQADIDRAGLPRLVERAISNPQPDNGKDNEKRDLAAQEASATFAFWVVVAAFVQAVVSIVGIYFIVLTLRQGGLSLRTAFSGLKQAGRAARAAEAGIKIAERSAVAAEGQVSGSEQSAKRQLRAYVNLVDQIDFGGLAAGETPRVHIKIRNSGQTPARKVVWHSVVAWRPSLTSADTFPINPVQDPSNTVIARDQSIVSEVGLEIPLTAADVAIADAEVGRLFIYGLITYEDVFEDRWTTAYRLFWSPSLKRFQYCPDGNEST